MILTFFKDKRGIEGIVTIFVTLMVSILLIVFGFLLVSTFNDKVQGTDGFTAEAKASVSEATQKYKVFDTGFALLWGGLFIVALISGWFIDTHPVFFFVSILGLIVVFVAFMPLVNLLETILSDSSISTFAAEFPIILFFADNFFKIIVIQSMIIVINMYAKFRSVE